MAKACCCYIIDSGYILPTLLSALQARASIAPEIADVVIHCVDAGGRSTAPVAALCEKQGIGFRSIDASLIDHQPIMYGRFFLHRMLDEPYSSVLYLDGDTQVAGSLEPLLAAPLDKGRFLAARDPMSILLKGSSQEEQRAYLDSIGLSASRVSRYFNSGVMRFGVDDLEPISKAVIALCKAHGQTFRFPDQDPLNVIFGRDYLTMSYKWNFPAFFLGTGFQTFIQPRIYHFMSNPRPWDGPFLPWGRAWSDPYVQLVARFPELEPFMKRIGRLRYAKYMLQQRYKRLFELPSWTTEDVRNSVLRIERESYV